MNYRALTVLTAITEILAFGEFATAVVIGLGSMVLITRHSQVMAG